MKYHITYRLMQPHYMPTMSVEIIQASSHAELDAKVAKLKSKWQTKEYTVQIMHVRQQKRVKLKQHP